MGFVKSERDDTVGSTWHERDYARDPAGFLEQLHDPDPSRRRWAARDLGEFPEYARELATALETEEDPTVRQALFDSLARIGTDEVVELLLPFLRSEDAQLRNGAVEVLTELPDATAPRMEQLLRDSDPDVRIFALDILRVLPHPSSPRWIADILARDHHVNVIAVAVDRAADVGSPEMVELLEEVGRRFADEPYIQFAIRTALERIAAGA